MAKWEYKLIDTQEDLKSSDVIALPSRKKVEEYLSALGNDGWEIISAEFYHETRNQVIRAVAKRVV